MSIIATRFIKASRVERTCNFCNRIIEIGEPTVRHFGDLYDSGEVGTSFSHAGCNKLDRMGYLAEELEKDNPYHA